MSPAEAVGRAGRRRLLFHLQDAKNLLGRLQRALDAEGILGEGPGALKAVAGALALKAAEIKAGVEAWEAEHHKQKSRNPEVELVPGAD